MIENHSFFQIPFEEFLEYRRTSNHESFVSKTNLPRFAFSPDISSGIHSEDFLSRAKSRSNLMDHFPDLQSATRNLTNHLVVNQQFHVQEAFVAALSGQADARFEVAAARRVDVNVVRGNGIAAYEEQSKDVDQSYSIASTGNNPEIHDTQDEREQLQHDIAAAQKKLSDDEQRIVELRRVHRLLHKRALRAEEHIDRLTETHKRQNEISSKKLAEKKRALDTLRTTALDSVLRSNQLDELVGSEQQKARTLEFDIFERRRALVMAISRREQLKLEYDRLTEARNTFEEILSQAEEALSAAEQDYYDSESNAILDSFFVDNVDERIDAHNTEDQSVEPHTEILIAGHSDEDPMQDDAVACLSKRQESVEWHVGSETVQPGPILSEPISEEEASFQFILKSFDDPSVRIQQAALRALLDLSDPGFALTKAMRESNQGRCRTIARSIAQSGVAQAAINDLASEFRSRVLIANTILLLMCKAGELDPLLRTIDEHHNVGIRQAVITILLASGHPEAITILRRVVVRGSLPDTVRSAALTALQQLRSVQHAPQNLSHNLAV